jgi:hypothetical protein
MNELAWLTCQEPQTMLEFLRDSGKASDRKFRLFQVACCRRIWHLLPDDSCRAAVFTAEQFADGHASDRQRRTAQKRAAPFGDADDLTAIHARYAVFKVNKKRCWEAPPFFGVAGVIGYATIPSDEQGSTAYRFAYRAEKKAETNLLRCIFGRLPFRRPLPLTPWVDRTVTLLAQAAYEERDLPSGHLDRDRLAVLSDALEEIGCTDAELLGHLRGPEPHVRGCWAVDRLLNRE